jgi:hypothetical protein
MVNKSLNCFSLKDIFKNLIVIIASLIFINKSNDE